MASALDDRDPDGSILPHWPMVCRAHATWAEARRGTRDASVALGLARCCELGDSGERCRGTWESKWQRISRASRGKQIVRREGGGEGEASTVISEEAWHDLGCQTCLVDSTYSTYIQPSCWLLTFVGFGGRNYADCAKLTRIDYANG
jgi:hypothetical protein